MAIMIFRPLLSVTFCILVLLESSFAQQPGSAPPPLSCEVCGCDTCTPGLFPMRNPLGNIAITPDLWTTLNSTVVPSTNLTVSYYLALYGFADKLPCNILDGLSTGLWEIARDFEDLCTDNLRLLPEFRSSCGCPSIPEGYNSSAEGAITTPPASPISFQNPSPVSSAPPRPVVPTTKTSERLLSRQQRRWVMVGAIVLFGLAVHLCVRAKVAAPKERQSSPTPVDDVEATEQVQESYLAAIEEENVAKAMSASLQDGTGHR